MEKQFNIFLKGESKIVSEKKIKRLINYHLKKRGTCYAKLNNGNSRLISHYIGHEPVHFLPFPISIFQWLFICSLIVAEFSYKDEEIFKKEFLFKDFNKAVNIFLNGLTDIIFIEK